MDKYICRVVCSAVSLFIEHFMLYEAGFLFVKWSVPRSIEETQVLKLSTTQASNAPTRSPRQYSGQYPRLSRGRPGFDSPPGRIFLILCFRIIIYLKIVHTGRGEFTLSYTRFSLYGVLILSDPYIRSLPVSIWYLVSRSSINHIEPGVFFFSCAFAKLRKASSCPSVRLSARNKSAPTGRIFIKLDVCEFFRKYVEKIQVSFKSNKSNGYYTYRPIYIFDHISLSSSQNEKCFRQKLQRE